MTRSTLTAILWIIAVAGPLTVAHDATASEGDRKVLRDRLVIFYVADPNAVPMSPIEVLNNSAIMKGQENEKFWSNSNVAGLHDLVRGLLRSSGDGGNDRLQFFAARTLELNKDKKPVVMIMLDDVTQKLDVDGSDGVPIAESVWGACVTESDRAWPCATDINDKTYSGKIWVGAHHMTSGRALGTFLHELTHTQDKSSGRSHLFTVGNANYRYGADGDHYDVELVPNLAMTYKEGIANAVRLMYSPATERTYFGLFANNGLLWVEKDVPAWWPGKSLDMFLYAQLQGLGVPEATPPKGSSLSKDYAAYRFHDLPPKYILHNEYVVAMTISQFVLHTHENRFYKALAKANSKVYGKKDASGLAALFEVMCTCGLPDDGTTLQDLVDAKSNPQGPKAYLLPLAFVDYFTGYGSKDEDEFHKLFEKQLSRGWIDLYWNERPAVQAAVPSPFGRTAKFDELTKIAMALDVTDQSD